MRTCNITKGLIIIMTVLSVLSCKTQNDSRKPEKDAKVKYSGMRSSSYGIKPFPDADEWDAWAQRFEAEYPGSVGTFVWIVGNVTGHGSVKNCTLNFPLDEKIRGVNSFPIDQNEAFLTMCDKKGYAVYLQVEPGDSDLPSLAEAVMKKYAHHSSLRGFGVDVEWYKPYGTDGWGIPFTDELAQEIDMRIKKINKHYRYFLKHWDERWMPPSYRSDIIFVNDSQMHYSLESMKKEFEQWADFFSANSVYFQIGYESDSKLWSMYANPVKELGEFIVQDLPSSQEIGIIWVDFTLRAVMK